MAKARRRHPGASTIAGIEGFSRNREVSNTDLVFGEERVPKELRILVNRASLDFCHQRGKFHQQRILGFRLLNGSSRPDVAILQASDGLETLDEAPRHHPISPTHKDDKHRDETQAEIARCALDIRVLLPTKSPVQTTAAVAEFLKSAPGTSTMRMDAIAIMHR